MTKLEIIAFLTIIECGSFSKAADMLFISQPALSRRIQSLENEIGYKLFERSKGFRNATLTAQGVAFINVADKMQQLFSDAEKIKKLDTSVNLKISCVESVNSILMPEIYKDFLQRKNKVNLSVYTQHSDRAYELVSRDMVDLGFIAMDMYFKNVETIPFYKEKMVLIANGNTFIEKAHPTYLDPRKEIFYMWSSEYTMWHSYWFKSTSEYIAQIDGSMVFESFISTENSWAIVPISVAEKIKRTSPISIYEMSDGPSDRIIYYITKPGLKNYIVEEFLDIAREFISKKSYLTLI